MNDFKKTFGIPRYSKKANTRRLEIKKKMLETGNFNNAELKKDITVLEKIIKYCY